MDFETESTRCFFYIAQLITEEWVFGIKQHADRLSFGRDFVQQSQSLRFHLIGKKAYAGEIATRTI